MASLNSIVEFLFKVSVAKSIVLPKNWTVQMINKFELLNEQKEKKIQFRV
jgi:hypothetical protein